MGYDRTKQQFLKSYQPAAGLHFQTWSREGEWFGEGSDRTSTEWLGKLPERVAADWS
jgi:hypothetical protein